MKHYSLAEAEILLTFFRLGKISHARLAALRSGRSVSVGADTQPHPRDLDPGE